MSAIRYLRAISANFAFFIVNTVFFLIVTPIAIHSMGDTLYGLWAVVNSILLFSSIGTLGISTGLSKLGAEEGSLALNHASLLTSSGVIILPMATLSAGVLVLARNLISNSLVSNPVLQIQVSEALLITAARIFPHYFARIAQGFLYSQLRFDIVRAIETGVNISVWIGAIWIANHTESLAGMVLWALVVQLVSIALYAVLLIRMGAIRPKWSRLAFHRIRRFSFYTFLQSAATSAYQNLDRVLVGMILGPGPAGIYSVATSVGLRLSLVTGQVTDILTPYSSRKNSLRQHAEMEKVIGSVSRAIDLGLTLLASLLILWMSVILRYWISPEYSAAHSQVFRVILLAYLLFSASRPGLQTLVGIGQIEIASILYCCTTVVMLVFLGIASVNWGLMGAAASNFTMAVLLVANAIPKFDVSLKHRVRQLASELVRLITLPLSIFALASFVEFGVLDRFGISTVLVLAVTALYRRDIQLRMEVEGYISSLIRGNG